MTFEEYAQKYLVDRGFFDNQAKEVVEAVKAAKENEPMQDRWNDSIDDYPPVMVSLTIITLNDYALKWIDENKPMAWFRGVFVN